jgi:hypothetical protein
LKRIVSILLLFALAFECFSELGILAYYQLNRDYIARMLCVNRDKPMMHCNGHCYLNKQLKENRQRENHGAADVQLKAELALFCSTEQHFSLLIPAGRITCFSRYLFKAYASPVAAVFHPPAVIC